MVIAVRIADSITSIESPWREASAGAGPFLSFEFLELLERTACTGPAAGWAPCHLLIEDDGEAVALMPAFLKNHSEGEFVFDWAWADAHTRHGFAYYPKLLVGIPFTPAQGQRVLTPPRIDRERSLAAAAHALVAIGEHLGVSSIHINFLRDDEAKAFCEAGFLERHGVQLHWHSEGAQTLADFLTRFDSKRRNQWKRELRRVQDAGIRWRRLSSEELTPERMAFVYRCYRATVDAHAYGRRYLTETFFQEIARSSLRGSLVVLWAERENDPIAMTFNVKGEGVLYGRYWGAIEHVPFLHFVLGYAAAIDTALAEGLHTMESGAGGDHKQARGFDPTITKSVHWIREPRLRAAIHDHVSRERLLMARHVDELQRGGPWRCAVEGDAPGGSIDD